MPRPGIVGAVVPGLGFVSGGRVNIKAGEDEEAEEEDYELDPEAVEAAKDKFQGGPQVIVPNKDDTVDENGKVVIADATNVEDGLPPVDPGKITFKKPSRKMGKEEERMDHTGEPDKKRPKAMKKSLLSFNEDEEEDE